MKTTMTLGERLIDNCAELSDRVVEKVAKSGLVDLAVAVSSVKILTDTLDELDEKIDQWLDE